VIPNKVFQIVAAQRPLITRDSPAIRELLAEDTACVRLVEAMAPRALADAVLEMRNEHQRSGRPSHCHARLQNAIGPDAIGAQCVALLSERSR
jgi:glycosyltransferase involved in cell wall biosynthesis